MIDPGDGHILDDKVVLLTGGTGFGRARVEHVLAGSTATVRVFSRDEFKQSEMCDEMLVTAATNDRFLSVEELRAMLP